jgi:hypothetical protein
MRRELHVRFCEGGGVQFPSATRLVSRKLARPTAICGANVASQGGAPSWPRYAVLPRGRDTKREVGSLAVKEGGTGQERVQWVIE